MESNPSEHSGKVREVSGNLIYVHIESRGGTRDCASCALAAACSGANGADLTVAVQVPAGVEVPPIGATVKVRPKAQAQRNATLELLVLPLVVFLCVAVTGTFFRLESGLTGILSIAAGALTYLPIYLRHRRQKPAWLLIHDT
ncbi:MAG: SoxR reducing system RseC family protein [Muribaculaceae bacterium]|nr:SoxR reducing system RseC family protein [Muribaculaceae bacterium]